MLEPKKRWHGGARTSAACLGAAVLTLVAACSSGAASSSTSGAGKAPLKIAIVVEMSGAGAAVGQEWNNGVRWAIQQVNAQGGVLGHKLQALTTLDTQTVPSVSVSDMLKALQQKPYAIMGTVYSSSTIVNAPMVGKAGVPQFSGSQGDTVLGKSNTLFFTQPSNNVEGQMFLDFMKSQYAGKSVVIVHTSDAATAPIDKQYVSQFPALGIHIAGDVGVDVGATDLSAAVHKVQATNPVAVVVATHEIEAAHLMVQLHAAGLNLPVIGPPAISQVALNLAKTSSDGAEGTTSFTPAAPDMAKVATAFTQANPSAPAPDANFLKAYVGVWALVYATEAVGKTDQAAVVNYLHNRAMCASKYPNLLGSEYWGSDGNGYRSDFLVQVQNGTAVVTKTLTAPQQLASCGS